MIKIATRKRRKKRKLKKEFVILFMIFIILIIIIMLINSLNKIKDTNDTTPSDENPSATLDSPEYSSEEDIFDKYNCEDVSKEYIENNFQINLNFERELYDENNNSNKEYFEDLIKELVKNYKRDFILKDEEKNITINVKVNSDTNYNYIINNSEEYFKETEQINNQIKEYKEIESIDAEISYKDFDKFDLNNWSVLAAGVEIKERGEDYLDYGKYKILTNDTYIDTILLSSEFEDEIIEGTKVGDSFDSIEQKLGNPTFQTNNMIGYKTSDTYVFFYNDEVAIYPNTYFNNFKIEDLIQKYINGEYTASSRFAYDVIHNCLDFESTVDSSGTVNLKSAVRGINIKITKQGNITADIYNNYNMTETTKKYIREGIANTNFDKDFVYETELNRVK